MSQPQALDLDAIQASIPTHYPAPWTAELNDDGSWNVVYPSDNPLAGHVAHVPDYGAHLAEFIAAARQNVPALVARVRQLEAERALYAGHEPTIAEEKAELSRRLDAVDAVVAQWNEHCIGTQTRFLLDDVRAAANGETKTPPTT
ncbi:hypothetical protein ABZW30_12565 [Kitasatospora sp. NPDC004669]|uniref:hypothetical protein n=1 Tax=Kitasatospora sp. NPDC004669 TaxID=3154555 RepID=UPI0033AC04B4